MSTSGFFKMFCFVLFIAGIARAENTVCNIDLAKAYLNAKVYTKDSKAPQSNESMAYQKGVTQPYFVLGNYSLVFSNRSSHQTAIQGVPTSIYRGEDGLPAYIGYNNPISLWSSRQFRGVKYIEPIPGQGTDRHPGFSTPVGKLKPDAKRTTDDLSQMTTNGIPSVYREIGVPGETVKLEFASGVVVEGKIKGYTTGEDDKLTVITFESGTATVTFGVHTLFKPNWGEYDLLVIPTISDSRRAIEHSVLATADLEVGKAFGRKIDQVLSTMNVSNHEARELKKAFNLTFSHILDEDFKNQFLLRVAATTERERLKIYLTEALTRIEHNTYSDESMIGLMQIALNNL